MNFMSWSKQLDEAVAEFSLLKHPFYVAWSNGELSRADIAQYAANYYHHVNAFPQYLEQFENRLPDGALKAAVKQNRLEENGHSDLWMDFAEGMGSDREAVAHWQPFRQITETIEHFRSVAEKGGLLEALACFYAYESQIPAVAREKGEWLERFYNADERTRFYFTLHQTADEEHAQVWRELMERELAAHPEQAQKALNTARESASMLWQILDGMNTNCRNCMCN